MILVLENDRSNDYHIAWFDQEESDYGATLGEGEIAEPSQENRGDWEHWAATKAVRETFPGLSRDCYGWCWESKTEASKAFRVAKAAMNIDRPFPEWAQKALAAGWKAPRGWKP